MVNAFNMWQQLNKIMKKNIIYKLDLDPDADPEKTGT